LVVIEGIKVGHICCSFCEECFEVLYSIKQFSCSFFLIKKEAKKSRTKDVHRLRPAAITIGCATVASAFIVCYGF